MKQSSIPIESAYHDVLLFASAEINRKSPFFLNFGEYKVLHKLIHYSKTYQDITFQNKDIAKHTFLAEVTVKDIIESLRRKGYITSERDIFNNRLGYASKRTIHINLVKFQEVYDIMTIYLGETPAPIKIEKPSVEFIPICVSKTEVIETINQEEIIAPEASNEEIEPVMVRIANGVVVEVIPEYVTFWDSIQSKLGIVKKLKSNYTQIGFDIDIKAEMEYQNNKKTTLIN